MAVGISSAVIVGGHFPMSPPRFKKNKDMGEGGGGEQTSSCEWGGDECRL